MTSSKLMGNGDGTFTDVTVAAGVFDLSDINGDGSVNVLDLIELLLAFGTSCP